MGADISRWKRCSSSTMRSICLAHVGRRQRPRLEEARHHQARLGMHHFRCEARAMRRPRHRHFALAINVVERKVARQPHHVFPRPVGGEKAQIGDAPRQRLERRCALPQRQVPRCRP